MARRRQFGCILLFVLILCGVAAIVVYMQLSMLLNVSQIMNNKDRANLRSEEPNHQRFDYSLSMIVASEFFQYCLVTYSLSQLNKLNYGVNAWLGEIVVGLCVFSHEKEDAGFIIRDLSFPSRVHVFQYHQKGGAFPINALRNFAISKAESSHIFIADVDIIPATNLREIFLSLPTSILRDSKHALIVPLFDTPHKSLVCDKWFDCIHNVYQYTKLSKKELLWCLRFNGCRNLGDKDYNKYSPKVWEHVPVTNMSIPLSCWDNPYQEPLLIVSNSPSLPLFDVSFVDFGYNRVQWVSNLRYAGYRFSVLSHSWAFHVKHTPSVYEKKSKEKSDPTKGKKGGVDTRRMFDNVIKKYEKEYGTSIRLPICEIQRNEVVKEEVRPEKRPKKKRLIRRVK